MTIPEVTEAEKAEVYLRARGWQSLGEGQKEVWFQPGRESGFVSWETAVSRQLKSDVIAFIYMLENLDLKRRPGTRRIIATMLTKMISEVIREFWNQEGEPLLVAILEEAKKLGIRVERVEPPKPAGEPN